MACTVHIINHDTSVSLTRALAIAQEIVMESITPVCDVCSPKSGSVSEMGIFRQLLKRHIGSG